MTLQSARKGDAILLVPISITQKYPHYLSLVGRLFKNVIQYDSIIRYKKSANETKDYFIEFLPDLNSVKDIYIWGAQYSFGIFCVEQKIPFIFCEEACGMMSRRNILEHIDELNPHLANLYAYVQELGLYTGKCRLAKKILCNFSAQLTEFKGDNFIDFDVVNGLLSLKETERKEIISFFTDIDKLHVPKESTIIFTQPLANLRLATFEDEVVLYQNFIDYFFENKTLVIKPHPDDLICYSKIFPDAVIIRERFPSEFLPFVLDNAPECVATIYSTAIYNLRGHYPQVFELDQSYERDFVKIHKYYMALKIAQNLNLPIFCLGMNKLMIEKLSESLNVSVAENIIDLRDFALPNEPCIIIVDDIKSYDESDRMALQMLMAKTDTKTVFLFINSQKDYCWYSTENKELWKNMLPIVLHKRLHDSFLTENFYASLVDEVMFAYSKDFCILELINEIYAEKDLPHVGINIIKNSLTDIEKKINILEGILEAAQQRILYYIEYIKNYNI